MRARIREDIDTKKIFILPLIILLLIIVIYLIAWFKVKNYVINKINDFYHSSVSLSYSSIKSSGFPFIIKTQIKDFTINIKSNIGDTSIIFENFVIKNLIFTKKANISFAGKIYLDGKDSNAFIVVNNDNIDISLDKQGSIDSLDGFIYNLSLVEDDYKVDVNNITLKLITSHDYNYINRTFRFNTDQIKYDSNESNFEFIFSNIVEKNSDNKIIALKNIVDVFSYNDISNNFNISLKADNNADLRTTKSPLNIKLTINNYNSLINSINNKDSVFLFNDKDKLSKLVQMLSIIPSNNEDTVNIKHYDFSMDLISKETYINGLSFQELLQKLLFMNETK